MIIAADKYADIYIIIRIEREEIPIIALIQIFNDDGCR